MGQTPPRWCVGDRVVCPGVRVVLTVGTVVSRKWSGIISGWMYAVTWDEGPDDPARTIGVRRNMEGGDTAIRWRETWLDSAR